MRGKRLFALLICLLLLAALVQPAALADETQLKRTVHITSVEDLRKLAADCRLDSYSTDLRVILDTDLDLSGEEFYPIPTFGGIFEGGGHRISGLRLATDGSHQGFFRYIQETGEVYALQLSGSIAPENGRCQLGGLAGENRGSISGCSFSGSVSGQNYVGGLVGRNYGSIRDCSVSGSVDGKRMTGGIAGYSEGLIAGCTNAAAVNTTISETALQLEDLRLSAMNAMELTSADDEDVVSDSGGIVGFSKGVVQDCLNSAVVGYPHFGYNVGGIAGRQSGFLTDCENQGAVYGRKDVGGIVGQMEPYLILKESVNLLEELNLLNQKLNAASGTLGTMSDEMQGALDQIDTSGTSAVSHYTGGGDISPVDGDNNGGDEGGGEGGIVPVNGSIAPADGAMSAGGTEQLQADNAGLDIPEEYQDYEGDISGIAEGMVAVYRILARNSGELSGELTDANNQLSRVMVLMANALNGAANRQVFEDVSDELEEDDVEGRVSRCRNQAAVEGDKNVGGVIGDMGIEYEFDLEGQLAEVVGIEGIVSNTFESKCVSSDNVNQGGVKGRKDGIGGISGGQEMGSILRCESYGSVDGSEGSYVGGVVGCSHSVVRQSYAMCNLSGTEYVGGIAGYGTTVHDCASMVGLADVTACSGAVAGWADASGESLSGNVFVHDSLGGVDGISYQGKAVPVSYEQLLQRQGLPEQFRTLHLRFVADGVLVKEVAFEYGGSINLRQIPPVPEKEGYTGTWPAYDFSRLYYSATLEAEYTPREGALAAKPTRDDSPMAIVLVEGDFDRGTEVLLNPYKGELPAWDDGQLLEAWTMRLSELGEGQGYSLRYLPPEVAWGHRVEIFMLRDGTWQQVQTENAGSYRSFGCQENLVTFAAVDVKEDHTALYAGIGGGAAVLLGLVLIGSHRRRKKKKAAAAAQQSEAS